MPVSRNNAAREQFQSSQTCKPLKMESGDILATAGDVLLSVVCA